jgi:phosphoribosylglycinamide formyltransferase-1
MNRLAVFASGYGSNAMNLYHYFEGHQSISPELIVTDNPNAGVIEKAKDLGIPCAIVPKGDLETDKFTDLMEDYNIDAIILAGFLKLIPLNLLKKYPERIVNIHPALLPDFGGKGMYGMRVHQAVISSKAKYSGITIHLVNEHYDKGKILFQKTLLIDALETPETLASKIHELEYRWYPVVVEEWLSD